MNKKCVIFVKYKFLIILILLVLIFIISLAFFKNNHIYVTDKTLVNYYKQSFKKYNKQLENMKKEFDVLNYADRDEKIGIFYFGMVDRTKMLYKDGKLINMKTQEVIKSFDYNKEVIIPNEYMAILEDNDKNIVRIYENEKGVYCQVNDKVEVISEGKKELNLPSFKDYKYSEILKVLHQEILFNIDGDIPKPNIMWYNEAWYRDSMLASMVLEETNNIHLFENWVKSIDKIYDNSRSSEINETDNLGELLYIIGAVGIERNDLIEQIIKEIENIKLPDNSIGGIVDFSYQKYYPTKLALFGAKKLGINLDLITPKKDDGYAMLTWYDKEINSDLPLDSVLYPYLGWAVYHYRGYEKIYILDEIYPLSYEAGVPFTIEKTCFISNYYCEEGLHLSHMWHASEMFLFLKDFKI